MMDLYIGLMSGTSMDSIDAALVDVDTHQLIACYSGMYRPETRQKLNHILENQFIDLAELCQLNTLIGEDFAQAALDLMDSANIKSDKITAIGSHGQTICHDPTAHIPYTLQLGCAHTISEKTGIQVVADFRTRDLILGGCGAPFAPIYHQQLFASLNKPLAIVNIGGIANISWIGPDLPTSGYDVGPGNVLMDLWTKKHLNQAFDDGGIWAKSGKINQALIDSLRMDPFFQQPPPKSIGKAYFSESWLNKHVKEPIAPEDIQATLLALTSDCISQSVLKYHPLVEQVYICGGGVHNHELLNDIQRNLPNICVESTETVGIHPDFIEAMIFAWMASKTIRHEPIDLTTITNARHPGILGAIYL